MPNAFISPIGVAVVPVVAAAMAARDYKGAKATVESSLRVTNLLAMPAAVGLFILARPIFEVVFPGSNEHGPALLSMLGIASYFVCAYLISNSILQATGHEKLALAALPVGGLLKIGINYVLVGNPKINISGAPVGTLACYVTIAVLNFIFIAVTSPIATVEVSIDVPPAEIKGSVMPMTGVTPMTMPMFKRLCTKR